jgi:hypothetical protein
VRRGPNDQEDDDELIDFDSLNDEEKLIVL